MVRLRTVISQEFTLIVVEGWEGLEELTSPSHISVYSIELHTLYMELTNVFYLRMYI